MKNRVRFIVLLLMFGGASSSIAVENVIADRWAKQLATTSDMLKAKSYQPALPILHRITSEMLEILGPSDEATYLLTVPLIQIALAEEGLGDHDDAIWHWHMAQTLYPKAAESDLSMFGDPGAVLQKNILANPNPESCVRPKDGQPRAKVSKTVDPKYPEGARLFRARGIVIIDLIIRKDGSVAEPRVVKPLPSPLTYAALEAIRTWRFLPSEVDGKAIESTFCLTINYKLK